MAVKEEILKKLDKEITITQSDIEMNQRMLIEYYEAPIPKKIFMFISKYNSSPKELKERISNYQASVGTLINIKEMLFSIKE